MAYARGFSTTAESRLRDWTQGATSSEDQLIDGLIGDYANVGALKPDRRLSRIGQWRRERQFAVLLHRVLRERARQLAAKSPRACRQLTQLLGVDFWNPEQRFEVHAVRPTLRLRSNGQNSVELVVLITQRSLEQLHGGDSGLTYRFRGGCTLLIDPNSGDVRYAVVKRINSTNRKRRQEQFLRTRLQREGLVARARYGLINEFERSAASRIQQEPFRLVHRYSVEDQWP
jgi:hypothetical protein